MRFTGTLKSWNDERGFGFIEPDQGGQELFVHIKAFPPGTGRPALGQKLSFKVESVEGGKKRATEVQYPPVARRAPAARGPRPETPAPWTLSRLLILPAFVALYAYVAVQWGFKPQVFLAYVVVSLAAFMMYAFDKSAAVAGRWRTPESTLHALALFGGWPGALLAQQLLRHKTAKAEFIVAFWATVGVNIALFVLWHSGALSAVLA
jgi:uncharacterized membrane protein YsdA (DUF1294 family)/cold shock CspA family protein